MGLKDKHDERTFRHFAKMQDDGTIAAIVEVADGMADPVDDAGSVYLEVTGAYPYVFPADAAIPVDLIAEVKAATAALDVLTKDDQATEKTKASARDEAAKKIATAQADLLAQNVIVKGG